MNKFQQRLQQAGLKANMRVADLARWFGRPHATLQGWVYRGIEPGGGPGDVAHIKSLLDLLETMTRKKTGFPIPIGLSPKDRIAYIKDIRDKVFPPET